MFLAFLTRSIFKDRQHDRRIERNAAALREQGVLAKELKDKLKKEIDAARELCHNVNDRLNDHKVVNKEKWRQETDKTTQYKNRLDNLEKDFSIIKQYVQKKKEVEANSQFDKQINDSLEEFGLI